MRKAPCISTDQSEIQEAANDHGGLVHPVYHGPLQKTRRNLYMSVNETRSAIVRLLDKCNLRQLSLVLRIVQDILK